MAKSHALEKKERKIENMGVKDGLIGKKKNQKFKNTPTGKVTLFNAKKKQQNGNSTNGTVKAKSNIKNNKQALKKDKVKSDKKKVVDEELDSEDENESIEDSDNQNNKALKNKGVKMFKGLKNTDKDESEDEDEDDDNEGVSLKALLDENLVDEDDDDDFEDNEDDDDDDDDSEDEDDSEGDEKSLENDEDDDDDDDDEDDEDDDDDGDNDVSSDSALKMLLGDSIADDDDDDDFNEDESDEDEDESDDDDDDNKRLKIANTVKEEDDDSEDDDDDEDDDDEDDDDDDEENESIGLQALLGDTLVDEEDDDDFEGDDDDEDVSDKSDEEGDKGKVKGGAISKSSTTKKAQKNEAKVMPTPEETASKKARTIFVGNVPKDVTVNAIKKLFRPCGEIETVRIRGTVPADDKTSFKVATIKKKTHPNVNSVHIYVVFKNENSVKSALKLNGSKLGDNTIRVDYSDPNYDNKRAIFIGNLPFDITEEEMRAHFSSCGKIRSIRVVRDRKTGLCKGFGYINFDEEDSVALGLELNNTKLKNRELRVKICCPQSKSEKRKHKNKVERENENKKFKNNKGKAVVVEGNEVVKGKKMQKRSQGKNKREKSSESQSPSTTPVKKEKKTSFQGQKADIKKKSKSNKMNKKKKIIAEKLTSTKKTSKTTD